MKQVGRKAIKVRHNLHPERFVYLWAKYVIGVNDKRHCTNSLRGFYSKAFSKHSPDFRPGCPIVLNERPQGSFYAVYVCGVARQGYSRKVNYLHNLHTAILPVAGAIDYWEFESWKIEVENGRFLAIPGIETLPAKYRALPDAFTSCRIFRWAVVEAPRIWAFSERLDV